MYDEITGSGVLRYRSGSPAVVVVRSGSVLMFSAPSAWEDFVDCAAWAATLVDVSPLKVSAPPRMNGIAMSVLQLRRFISVSFFGKGFSYSLRRDDGIHSNQYETNPS